jgi:amidohydrolase
VAASVRDLTGAAMSWSAGSQTALVKAGVQRGVEDHAGQLLAISHRIHARPELAFRETHAAGVLAQALASAGFRVEYPAYGLETAFAARAGRGAGPHVLICCEYDALPGLGHACGHNVIAAASLGAGLALAPFVTRLGGRLTMLGTPAEEGGAGKELLARRGALRGVDAAMMVHPNAYETAYPRLLAAAQLQVELHGRAAHASLFPERGVNALDALVLGYLGVSMLRQQLPPGDRVSGIVVSGGQAVNVIPDHTAGRWLLRAPHQLRLRRLEQRVLACARGGAAAAGARCSVVRSAPDYAELIANRPLAEAYAANARRLGRRLMPPGAIPDSVVGSTDMGNIARRVPAIHPMIAIAPWGVAPHTREFCRAAVSPAASRAVLDGAKALGMTAVDLWLDPSLGARAWAEFRQRDGRAVMSGPCDTGGPGAVTAGRRPGAVEGHAR